MVIVTLKSVGTVSTSIYKHEMMENDGEKNTHREKPEQTITKLKKIRQCFQNIKIQVGDSGAGNT